MWAMSHDFRIMRNDYGKCCVSEINLGAYIPRGMAQLMRDKLEPDVIRDLVGFGLKMDGPTCARRNIVDQAVPPEKLMSTCKSLAKTLAPKSHHRQVFS